MVLNKIFNFFLLLFTNLFLLFKGYPWILVRRQVKRWEDNPSDRVKGTTRFKIYIIFLYYYYYYYYLFIMIMIICFVNFI